MKNRMEQNGTEWNGVLRNVTKCYGVMMIIILSVVMTGCSHNVHARGFYFACPYGAIGYGEASCVKGNTTVESSEEVGKDGVLRTKNTFKVGKQTTGYDVEREKVLQKRDKN